MNESFHRSERRIDSDAFSLLPPLPSSSCSVTKLGLMDEKDTFLGAVFTKHNSITRGGWGRGGSGVEQEGRKLNRT